MNYQIEPISYGIAKTASLLEILWGEIPLNSDSYCIKLLLKDSLTNLLDTVEVKLLKSQYMELGNTKEERIDAIVSQKGIAKLPPVEMI